MKTRKIAVFLTLALVAVAGRAGADGAAPQVSDAAGDANFVNSQGNAGTGANGPDTRPASIDSADIRSILFSTTYSNFKLYNSEGVLTYVVHVPTGLRIDVTMEGNVKPTFGPSLLLRIATRVVRPGGGVCEAWFQAWWRGPQALAEDQERADIRRLTAVPACPAVNTVSAGFSQSISGKVITMAYPFSAASMPGFIENGTLIDAPQVFTNSSSYVHLRPQFALVPTAPPVTTGPTILTSGSIDEAAQFPGFTVGSDVPPTTDCLADPAHPDCQPDTP